MFQQLCASPVLESYKGTIYINGSPISNAKATLLSYSSFTIPTYLKLLINLIEWTFKREGSPYITCNERQAFFTSEDTKRYKLWSCQNVCEALIYLLDNIYIRFGTKLYRQIVGIPMGTNCAPLVADLFLFCYERDFMTSLSDISKLILLKHLNLHLDIWTTFYILTILNLKAWSIVFIRLNCS